MLLSLLLASLAGTAPAGALTGRTLERRGPQTSAVCTADFAWADNSKGVSPCMLAAVVIGACQGGSWDIPALNSSNTYTRPSSTTANGCTCSWLSYNLLAACADCQGVVQAVPNVAPYFQSCGGFETTTNSYFPADYSLPDNTFIPYWATTDPTTWPSQHFDIPTAKSIALQGHADIGNATTQPSKKKASIGVIVGGAIGGLAVMVSAVGIAFFMCRRRTTGRQRFSQPLLIEYLTHARSPSDMTMTSTGSYGYATLVSTPTSPSERRVTIRTSAQSLSYPGSPVTTIPPTTRSSARFSRPPSNIQDVIHPFTSAPAGPSNIPPGDRKKARESITASEPTVASPISIPKPAEPRRSRINPPPYSPTDDSPSSPPRAQRLTQRSTDTYHSYASGTHHGGGAPSGRGVSPINETPIETSAPSGRVVVGPNRDSKRQKERARSVDPRDLA